MQVSLGKGKLSTEGSLSTPVQTTVCTRKYNSSEMRSGIDSFTGLLGKMGQKLTKDFNFSVSFLTLSVDILKILQG